MFWGGAAIDPAHVVVHANKGPSFVERLDEARTGVFRGIRK